MAGRVVIRELITLLGFDVDELAIKKAETGFKGLAKLSLGLTGVVTGVGVALFELARRASDAGDHAAKTAIRLGITAEEVQQLGYAAEISGVNIESIGIGLRTLQKNAVAAAKGNKEAAASFAGISFRKGGQIAPTVELFQRVAQKIAETKDPAKQTALALKVFGRAGYDLLPLLKEGGDGIERLMLRAEALGFVIDDTSAKLAEELNDALTDLRLAADGVTKRLGVALMPVVLRVVNTMTNWLIANRKLIDDGIKKLVGWINTAVDVGYRFANVLSEHTNFLKVMAAVITGLALPALTKLGWAWLRAVLWPAILAAAFVAALVVVAAVIEDVYTYVNGGKSALGELFDYFEHKGYNPDQHPILATLKFILEVTKQTIDSLNTLFRIFADEAAQNGVWSALKNQAQEANRFLVGTALGLDPAKRGEINGRKFIPKVSGGPSSYQPFGSFVNSQLGGSAAGASTLLPAGANSVMVEGATVNVSVSAQSGDPHAIAKATADQVEKRMMERDQEQRRQLKRELGLSSRY